MINNFHQQTIAKVAEHFQVDLHTGLAQKTGCDRLKTYGYNEIPGGRSYSLWSLIFSQFKDFMIMILMLATVVSALIGHTTDALTIMFVVFLNGLMGFIQEYRAEKSLALLQKLSSPKVNVLRQGEVNRIEARELVPGDILILEAGDRVGADARLFDIWELDVEEAFITGESLPAAKCTEVMTGENIALGDRQNMVFSGSLVTRGRGRAIVTATGEKTQVGNIAYMLRGKAPRLTPLQKRMKQLGTWLVSICFISCVLIVLVGVAKGEPLYHMVLAGISLAVAAIPEGLPAIVTLSLALGVQRMIKKKALVRKLPAVETLGCAKIICADKTGTLTMNKMSVDRIYTPGKIWDDNSFSKPELASFWRAAVFCNEASIKKTEKTLTYIGDPTDGALILAAYEAGIKKEDLMRHVKGMDIVPFSSEKKMMSVLVKERNRQIYYCKGAPEIILSMCTINNREKGQIEKTVDELSNQGLRLIAMGQRMIPGNEEKMPERGLNFLGVAALKDPPRPGVKEAVKICRQAGVEVMMVTGDHIGTARAIAREVGILQGQVWDGKKLGAVDEVELHNKLPEVSVLARVNPADKLKVVKTLRKLGQVVAMTGDGINDAPAIKEADIGIAMGERGTEISREVASLILADDNFSTIVAAIEEGRIIYSNIRKFIRYLLSCNMGELISVMVTILLGLPLPFLPTQILWVNLVTDGLPALALGMDPLQEDVMDRKPRSPTESVFSRGLGSKIIFQGFLIGLAAILAFVWGLENHELFKARTIAFTTLVMSQLIFVFSCWSENLPLWQIKLKDNLYILGAVAISFLVQLAVLYWLPLQIAFSTTSLPLQVWPVILTFSAVPVFLWEIGRYFINLLSGRV